MQLGSIGSMNFMCLTRLKCNAKHMLILDSQPNVPRNTALILHSAFSSAASAIHGFGDKKAAATLDAYAQESLKRADRMDFLNHIVLKILKGWDVAGALTGDTAAAFDCLATRSPYPTCIRIRQGSQLNPC